jgi:uncharacterized protein
MLNPRSSNSWSSGSAVRLGGLPTWKLLCSISVRQGFVVVKALLLTTPIMPYLTLREYNLSMVAAQTLVSLKKIVSFCKRWQVIEFALFGSVVRDDFSSLSDIDALVSFDPESNWGLFDHIQMNQELKQLFGREVDLITRRALEQSRNALLRSEILNTAKVLYSENTNAHV